MDKDEALELFCALSSVKTEIHGKLVYQLNRVLYDFHFVF
jgi:hypothetical protein